MWMSVCPSVRVCPSQIFAIFTKSIYMRPLHPQIPFAKRAQKCPRTHLKIYPRMLPLMSKFYDHFFAKKYIFIKKVPSFTRYKNLRKSPKLVLTDSVILIGIVQKVLFSSWHTSHNVWRVNYFVAFSATKLRATRPAGCCLVGELDFWSRFQLNRDSKDKLPRNTRGREL